MLTRGRLTSASGDRREEGHFGAGRNHAGLVAQHLVQRRTHRPLGPGETIDLDDGATVAQLRDTLIARGGAHAAALGRERPVRAALNQVLIDEASAIPAGAEVAFFPPVTGG